LFLHWQVKPFGDLSVGEKECRNVGVRGRDESPTLDKAEVLFKAGQATFCLFAVGGLEGSVELLAADAKDNAKPVRPELKRCHRCLSDAW